MTVATNAPATSNTSATTIATRLPTSSARKREKPTSARTIASGSLSKTPLPGRFHQNTLRCRSSTSVFTPSRGFTLATSFDTPITISLPSPMGSDGRAGLPSTHVPDTEPRSRTR
jgi:hypothetical protein